MVMSGALSEPYGFQVLGARRVVWEEALKVGERLREEEISHGTYTR